MEILQQQNIAHQHNLKNLCKEMKAPSLPVIAMKGSLNTHIKSDFMKATSMEWFVNSVSSVRDGRVSLLSITLYCHFVSPSGNGLYLINAAIGPL